MPRKARIILENAYYHIITRGNQKQPVFGDRQDYKVYLNLLAKYKKKYRFKIYCFCLMPNHVHLIIGVPDGNILNKIMHGINLSYTLHFNYKYTKVGHLWQDRFKSRVIQKDAYLFECINYIEANPVRADLCLSPKEYPWSSLSIKKEGNSLIDELFYL